MKLRSIFRNKLGKHPAAVYECSVDEYVDAAWIEALFRKSYGKNVTAYGYTYTGEQTRWCMLITNAMQTTVRDVTSRIEAMGRVNPAVSVIASTAVIGQADITGTPRRGTRRTRPNSPGGSVVTAR